MACGVAVVCSDLPVLREIADGVAIFYDPVDPAAFARALTAILDAGSGDRRRLGIERAKAFTWERAGQQTVEAYETVLGVSLVGPALEEHPGRRQDQDLQVER